MATLITTAADITTITIGLLIQNCQIDSLRIEKTGARAGIGIDVLGNDAIMTNCFMRGKALGVRVNNAYSCQVVGTNITNCVDAVQIIAVAGIELNTTVIRCSLYGNDNNGIVLENTQLNIITSNQIFSNGMNGIVCNELCDYNNISNNIMWDNTNDGIKLTATSDRNSIVGNTCFDNGGIGINIAAASCDKNVVVANVLHSNTGGEFTDNGTSTEVGHNVTT
ncbi:unnamed protein product [marine sediment metagenome]|uniref:Periplasmic copper-binding protein NosD beta helix domain-containing protein n=1 Tax=marine sediment metagenome TaxID=412755 RepID=X1SG97_9ZZZZ